MRRRGGEGQGLGPFRPPSRRHTPSPLITPLKQVRSPQGGGGGARMLPVTRCSSENVIPSVQLEFVAMKAPVTPSNGRVHWHHASCICRPWPMHRPSFARSSSREAGAHTERVQRMQAPPS